MNATVPRITQIFQQFIILTDIEWENTTGGTPKPEYRWRAYLEPANQELWEEPDGEEMVEPIDDEMSECEWCGDEHPEGSFNTIDEDDGRQICFCDRCADQKEREGLIVRGRFEGTYYTNEQWWAMKEEEDDATSDEDEDE